MHKAAARSRTTPRISYPVAMPATARELAPYVRAVVEVVRGCPAAGSWRKKDLLRGRVRPVLGVLALLHDLKRRGSSNAHIEGVLIALHNAGRALTRPPMDHSRPIIDAMCVEQEMENAENLDSLRVLPHPTPGTLRQLRSSAVAEMTAQRELVDLIDAKLLTLEGQPQ